MSTILGNPITLGGGGAKLNIDFGTAQPSDTSKLWVPLATKPSAVKCSPVLNYGSEYLSDYSTIGSGTQYSSSSGSWGSCFQDGDFLYWGKSNGLVCLNIKTNEITLPSMSDVIGVGASNYYTFCQNGRKLYLASNRVSIHNTNYSNAVVEIDLDTKAANLVCYLPYDSELGSTVAYMAMEYLDGKLYLFGGMRYSYANVSNKIKIVDLSSKKASVAKATIPVAAKMFSTCVVGSKIYIMGGAQQDTPKNGVYCYDTISDTCTAVATYPVTVAGMSCVSFGQYIYCFGGSKGNFNNGIPNKQIDTIYRFDTSTNTFTQLSTKLPEIGIWLLFYKFDNSNYKFAAPSNAGQNGQYTESKTPYTEKFVIETSLTSNHLFLQADYGYDGLWTALKSKDTDFKVKVINAYIGDSNNIAQLTDAYLYDSDSATWKSLDGVSMTADMLNALATLGVT